MFVSDDNEPGKYNCLRTFEMDSRRVLLLCSPFSAVAGRISQLVKPYYFFPPKTGLLFKRDVWKQSENHVVAMKKTCILDVMLCTDIVVSSHHLSLS